VLPIFKANAGAMDQSLPAQFSEPLCAAGRAALIWSAMIAGMNWLDYALLAIIGFGVLHGLSHGVLRMATSILSFVLGLYAASLWYGRGAALAQSRLGTSPASSEIIGYIAVFLVVFVAIGIVGRRVIALAELVHLNLIDRLVGAVFGAALATIFAGLDIVLLTAILPPNYPLLQSSKLAPEILSYDQKLLACVPPQVKQTYEDKRDRLVRYWNTRGNKPATAPDPAR
jgi:membrane protein required for colicin V production